MIPGLLRIVFQSIKFYKKPVLYQVLIIALLSAVITGSLMTGSSVRMSLRKSSSERLGNTGVMISSGIRYFDVSLAERLKDSAKINCTGILEIKGYCQSLNSQKGAFNTHIYAIDHDFFSFHGQDQIRINPGEIAVNKKLADYLKLETGDELIIRFKEITAIPSDAPFAPAKESGKSVVLKVGSILEPFSIGNFSLSISQILPMNIFINLSDLTDTDGKSVEINRLLIDNKNDLSTNEIYSVLKHELKLSDIGIKLREIKNTGEIELTSERVFLDDLLINEVKKVLPASAPVITYLANKFSHGSGSTPYSFISALPASLYPEIATGNGIIINRWLAEDLLVSKEDTIQIFWYSPDSLNKLIENSHKFIVKGIAEMSGIWSDSLLMPDFPGISGSESCSDWDAGVPIKMDNIRRKDEEYWNRYRGTPKAFISYEKGKELWGNNFGPATALRFPATVSEKEIRDKLKNSIEPGKTGFNVLNLSEESVKAANESVDFGTLFLSLGFFLLLASIVLLSFTVSSYFESKKGHINTFFALGFQSRWIERLFFLESGIIALTGCFIGAFAGYLVNILITVALNSVWQGAVQTNTLNSFFSITPIITGFLSTLIISGIFMQVKIKGYLKKLNRKEKARYENVSPGRNLFFLIPSVILTISFYALSIILESQKLLFSFSAGTSLLITFILFWRQLFIGRYIPDSDNIKLSVKISRPYYSFYPSHAVTPILFLAAGIFAVFITGANRVNFNETHLKRPGGTGGFLLWCETTIPVLEDLNTISGKESSGLDTGQLKSMSFVLMKRSSGDDASCLNLNHVTAPPLIGVDATDFIAKGSFSFAKKITGENIDNPWQFLNITSDANTIYGIADQTVLEWGLKIKPGDTLILRAENGQKLNIIIAAGLKSSVFQGFVLIGMRNFMKYYPSVSGSSILLVDGDQKLKDVYKSALNERLGNAGINVEQTTDRLASFYEVTNSYLSVFGVFGALGMITGIAGLGFVLLRNYNHRKKEFALMLATGFSVYRIRKMILSEQMLILFAGITSGVVSAIVATLPSLTDSPEIPWLYLFLMVFAIIISGFISLILSVRSVTTDSLTASLKKE